MTRDEAISVVEMILNSWPGGNWEEAKLQAYVSALMPHDAAITTRATAKAVQKLKYRPSIAELREFIQLERRLGNDDLLRFMPVERIGRPEWVDRWYRARAAGDYRPFPEQLHALDMLARMSPEHYAVYAPPEHPITDPEHWIQDTEYLQAPAL